MAPLCRYFPLKVNDSSHNRLLGAHLPALRSLPYAAVERRGKGLGSFLEVGSLLFMGAFRHLLWKASENDKKFSDRAPGFDRAGVLVAVARRQGQLLRNTDGTRPPASGWNGLAKSCTAIAPKPTAAGQQGCSYRNSPDMVAQCPAASPGRGLTAWINDYRAAAATRAAARASRMLTGQHLPPRAPKDAQ